MNKDNDNDYIIIDPPKDVENKSGIYIKEYPGAGGSTNIKLSRAGQQIHFNWYRLHGMYFVNINGEHIFDFNRLCLIDHISNVGNDCVIQNSDLGEIMIPNCSVKLFEKALFFVEQRIKKKRNLIKDIFSFLK